MFIEDLKQFSNSGYLLYCQGEWFYLNFHVVLEHYLKKILITMKDLISI